MTQRTLALGGFDARSNTTREEAFLAHMDKRMLLAALIGLIELHYPKIGNGKPRWQSSARTTFT